MTPATWIAPHSGEIAQPVASSSREDDVAVAVAGFACSDTNGAFGDGPSGVALIDGPRDEWAYMLAELTASTSRLREMVQTAQALRASMSAATDRRNRSWIAVGTSHADHRHW